VVRSHPSSNNTNTRGDHRATCPHHRHRHHHHRRHDRCVNIVLKPTPPHKFHHSCMARAGNRPFSSCSSSALAPSPASQQWRYLSGEYLRHPCLSAPPLTVLLQHLPPPLHTASSVYSDRGVRIILTTVAKGLHDELSSPQSGTRLLSSYRPRLRADRSYYHRTALDRNKPG
jgi:hypothetical protein